MHAQGMNAYAQQQEAHHRKQTRLVQEHAFHAGMAMMSQQSGLPGMAAAAAVKAEETLSAHAAETVKAERTSRFANEAQAQMDHNSFAHDLSEKAQRRIDDSRAQEAPPTPSPCAGDHTPTDDAASDQEEALAPKRNPWSLVTSEAEPDDGNDFESAGGAPDDGNDFESAGNPQDDGNDGFESAGEANYTPSGEDDSDFVEDYDFEKAKAKAAALHPEWAEGDRTGVWADDVRLYVPLDVLYFFMIHFHV